MSSPVVTIGPDATLRAVVELMLDRRVGSVVVLDDGLAGIVTESDVLSAVRDEDGSLSAVTVADVMSADLVTTTSTTSVTSALRTMQDEGVK